MIALLLSTIIVTSPADELRTAAADIETQPLELRSGTRYLTLYTIPQQQRRETLQVLGYTLNALSRTRAISQPVQISPTPERAIPIGGRADLSQAAIQSQAAFRFR